MRVLVVEDTNTLSMAICEALAAAHISPVPVSDGLDACEMLDRAFVNNARYDVVILDLTLPRMDGIKILERMRDRCDMTPVIVLTARSELSDRTHGLEIGCDDYMGKPFDHGELVLRVKAIARRFSNETSVGNLSYDKSGNQFLVDGKSIILKKTSFTILQMLFERKGKVLTRDQLLELCSVDSMNVLDNHFSQIRRVLQAAGSTATIKTAYGLGFSLEAPAAEGLRPAAPSAALAESQSRGGR